DVLQAPTYRDIPLVLAPTPATLDDLAASGQAGRALLGDLQSGRQGREVVAQPYSPVDVSAMVRAGLGEEVASQRRRGTDTTTAVLGARPDTRTWIADDHLDDEALGRLQDMQIDRVVVPEAALAPSRLQLTLAQPFALEASRGTPLEATVADAGLSAHFRNSGDQVLAAHQFLADLAVIWLDSPQKSRAVVAVTPRRWRASRAFLDAALSGIAASPVVAGMSLDSVFTSIDPALAARNRPLVRALASRRDRTPLGLSAVRVRKLRDRLE